MKIHPRTEWVEPARPVAGPAFPHWTDIYSIALHHPGAGTIRTDTVNVLRAMQRHYLATRKYSLGYNWAVDRNGDIWEIRGWRNRSAATAGRDGRTNLSTFAILALTSDGEAATPAMAASIRSIVAEARRLAGRPLELHPHHHYDATACCGLVLTAQLNDGQFDPARVTAPPATVAPTPPATAGTNPPMEDEDMTALRRYRDVRYHNIWLAPSGLHLSPKLNASYEADGIPLVEDLHDETLNSFCTLSGIAREDLAPWN